MRTVVEEVTAGEDATVGEGVAVTILVGEMLGCCAAMSLEGVRMLVKGTCSG